VRRKWLCRTRTCQEDCSFSLGDFMRQPISSSGDAPVPDNLTPGIPITLRTWVFRMFQEIHRLTNAVAAHEEPVAAIPPRSLDSNLKAWEETQRGSLNAEQWTFADERE